MSSIISFEDSTNILISKLFKVINNISVQFSLFIPSILLSSDLSILNTLFVILMPLLFLLTKYHLISHFLY